MKYNQKGFSVVEILIVIVAVGLIFTVSWLAYARQKNQTSDLQTSNSQEAKKTQTSNHSVEENLTYLMVGLLMKIKN